MAHLHCPFCGEAIEIWIDPGGDDQQEYIEDCSVCCRPIRLVASRGPGLGEDAADGQADDFEVQAYRD